MLVPVPVSTPVPVSKPVAVIIIDAGSVPATLFTVGVPEGYHCISFTYKFVLGFPFQFIVALKPDVALPL